MKGMKYGAVLFACLPLSLPLKANGDICYSSFVKTAVQDGQDVVLLLKGVKTLRRHTETEVTEIEVPADIYTESCPSGWPNDYCYYDDCGHFRDVCVPPGTVHYDGLMDDDWTTDCCDTHIEVVNTDASCQEECEIIAWAEGSAHGSTIEVTLMTNVPGTLYRIRPCHGNQTYYLYKETELTAIRPEQLHGQCRASEFNEACCLPCGRLVDRCPEVRYDYDYYSYKFVPDDPSYPIKWSSCLKVEADDDCQPDWEIASPSYQACTEAPDTREESPEAEPETEPDADEENLDDDAGVLFDPRGGGASCSFGGPGASHLLMVVLLLFIGFLALSRGRR